MNESVTQQDRLLGDFDGELFTRTHIVLNECS